LSGQKVLDAKFGDEGAAAAFLAEHALNHENVVAGLEDDADLELGSDDHDILLRIDCEFL
jgi:hypothetical protein